jgi:DNA-binding response OmpR family regulator
MSAAKPLVLVADDDAEICALVRRQLERAGMEVVTAGNGEQALALARERRPSAAVLDVMMPGLNGYQVAARLREAEDTSRIGIVLLTARAGGLDESYGYEVGADDYVRKPFKGDELRARVRAVLQRG